MSAPDRLNAAQRRAVEHTGGPVLVLAGPGTGKTGVLVERIAHLVGERGVSPGRVLALTFSRRAADEMTERVRRRVPEAAFVECRTFHSFALSLVRRYASSLGLRSAPEIIPTNEQWALVSDILGDENPAAWGLPPGAFERPAAVREVYDLMLRSEEHLLSPDGLRERGKESGEGFLLRAGEVLEEYRSRLDAGSMADYEGVVQSALALLAPGSGTAEEIRSRYDHVLVDEFQDTNRSQLELLRRLRSGTGLELFCVGDDAQSIYAFRGARVENVRTFAEVFPGASEIHLRTNYRSAAHVVSLAERAIAGDESRPRREAQTVATVGSLGTVLHRLASSYREEGEWIADRIVELTQGEGVPRERIAVLRRSLLDAEPLVDALASRGIPVDVDVAPGGSSVRHLATLLAAADGEDPDPAAASSALLSPLCAVPAGAARALRLSSEASGRSVFEVLRSGDGVGGVPEDEMARARSVVRAVDAASLEEDFTGKLDALWKGLPETRALFERHVRDGEAARSLGDALSFVRSAHAYARVSRNPSVGGFLAAGRMLHEDSDTWAPAAPPAEGAVRLITVHASKGLEFDAVFLSGLVDGRFPVRSRGARFADPGLLATGTATPREELDRAHLFEERRLFYVALTRARTYLFLTGVEESGEDGLTASPFLRELEDRLVELADASRRRRFWVSREAAVEDLRRTLCRQDAPPSSRFAAGRALRALGEEAGDWWRYLRATEGVRVNPELRDVRAREVIDHLECPRRALFDRASSGGIRRASLTGGSGRLVFGSAFGSGLRSYLEDDRRSLEEAVLESAGSGDFGGPALDEYWRRQASDAAAANEGWARKVREDLVSPGGEWELEVEGKTVRGRHGPVVERDGERTLLQIKTGKRPARKVDAASDVALALQALGTGAERAMYVYPRKFSYGGPTERELDVSEGLEWFREELAGAIREMESGESAPRPRSPEVCGRCAYRSVCPLHMEDEPWG